MELHEFKILDHKTVKPQFSETWKWPKIHDLHNNHLLNNCNLHLAWHQTIGTPKVLSMVILGVGVGDWLVNPLPIGFLMASQNAYFITVSTIHNSSTSLSAVVFSAQEGPKWQGPLNSGPRGTGWQNVTPWPGVPGLHILQCNRIGYRHWSLSQFSCQLDNFPENIITS